MVGDRLNEQGNLTKFVLGSCKTRDLCTSPPEFSVYTEALTGLRHSTQSRWSHYHVALSSLCPCKGSSCWNDVWNTDSKDRSWEASYWPGLACESTCGHILSRTSSNKSTHMGKNRNEKESVLNCCLCLLHNHTFVCQVPNVSWGLYNKFLWTFRLVQVNISVMYNQKSPHSVIVEIKWFK